MTKTVDHIGRVQEISTTDVQVTIINNSACADCHAKGACGMADSAEKKVVVQKSNHNFSIGQEVKVILRQSLGFKALLLGYIIPFFLVVISLILFSAVGVPEGAAGLISLSILLPYYVGLHLFRNRISKHFTFDIESV
jgi:sigma-E factor negative regulatory protein RseC